jgi:MoaA/NifB/PqqE/SkfB family radical SAM enzyme
MSSGDPLPQGEIGTPDRLRAINLFADHCPGSKVTFTGGEALLNPDIFLLLEHAKSRGLRTELYSNGLTIKNGKVAERIISLVNDLQVSIDGATEGVNDAIRGRGTFKKIVRGIRLIDQSKRTLNARNFRLRLALTLTSSNVTDIRDNIDNFVMRLGLLARPEIRIGTVGKMGRAKENPDLVGDHDGLQMAQAEIVNEFSRSGMHRMHITQVNRFTKTCGMGLTITVGADGSIYHVLSLSSALLGTSETITLSERSRRFFIFPSY